MNLGTASRHKPWAIVDLDSTLCDTTHRQGLIVTGPGHGSKTDWKAYSMACKDDDVVESVRVLVNQLGHSLNICLLSGRNACALDLTTAWLNKKRVLYDYVQLRPDGDLRKNATFKTAFLTEAKASGWEFMIAIDDFPDIVDAFKAFRLPVLLIQPPSEHPLARSAEWDLEKKEKI